MELIEREPLEESDDGSSTIELNNIVMRTVLLKFLAAKSAVIK
jgi:hypothetical protein